MVTQKQQRGRALARPAPQGAPGEVLPEQAHPHCSRAKLQMEVELQKRQQQLRQAQALRLLVRLPAPCRAPAGAPGAAHPPSLHRQDGKQ